MSASIELRFNCDRCLRPGEHDAEFRKLVYKQQQERFAIWDPDPEFEIPFSSDP